MIIDTHTHIFSEDIYESYFKKAEGNIDKAITIHFWNKLSIDKKEVPNSLEELISLANNKGNIYVVGSVDVDADIDSQLTVLEEHIKKEEICGVKLYPGYQYFYPSDEKINPIAELCEKHNKPLIFHSGDVFSPSGKAMLEYSRPIHVDKLATLFPDCKIVIAHFGFPYLLETANIVSKNKNVFTEISGTIDNCESEEEATKLVEQYMSDLSRVFNYFPDVRMKTMFGTDYGGEHTPLNQIQPYIKIVEGIFSKDEQENIFKQLAEEVFFN